MSTTVTYKGSTLATVNNNTKTLKTAGKYMEGDIVLTDVSGGTGAISVVDTTDTAGGTIRTITALDISDTTAVASDVASGKYFYTSAGVKTAGTGSGGSATLTTKTITENGTYNASSDNADGYSSVTVNVSGGVTWDTVYNGGITIYSSSPNYAIIQNFTPALAADQTWRITWNGNEFICSTEYSSQLSSYYIGNPSVVGDTDDGSGATFFGYMQSGNLTFATTTSAGSIMLKMERIASGSGNAMTTVTGTVTGAGTNTIQISCDFEPREIYIRGDLTGDATLRGIVSFVMIKNKQIAITNDSSTSNTTENAYMVKAITGYNEANSASEPYASYSNGTLTIDTVVNSSGVRWPSGITYSYTLVGFATPTEHIIHLEFSDSSETDISLNYDNSLIGTMITAYNPSTWTYSSKTVTFAQLDNVTWYDKQSIPLNTELVDLTTVVADYNLNSSGELQEAQWYGVTDYIRIDPSMEFSFRSQMWAYNAFYDSSQNFISSFSPYNSGVSADPNDSNTAVGTLGGTGISIPSTAAYIRLGTLAQPDNSIVSLIRTA